MVSLLLRNLFFTILQPGLVAGLFPYWILDNLFEQVIAEPFHWHQYIAAPVFVAGFLIMITCILQFAIQGRGTLSPADPTKKLVIRGLYKYSRNPMYVGVILMLAGETLFFSSVGLLVYSGIIALSFILFVIVVEEPRLSSDFGAEYAEYRKKVRRWI
jgi:protein-S-isoprenylcysteine O-methyltransferase Ste14